MQSFRFRSLLEILICLLAFTLPAPADEPTKPGDPLSYVVEAMDDRNDLIHLTREYPQASTDFVLWRDITSQGSRFQPVSDILRQHLKIPAGRGLVLMQHLPTTQPADETILKRGDILLQINDTPVSDAGGLLQLVRDAQNVEVQLQLMRDGGVIYLPLAPAVLLGMEEKRYRIGVNVDGVDDTLRAQLRLIDAEGLVVTEVLEDRPAKTAGIKQHDVLLIAGDTKLTNFDSLARAVQASGGKPLAITLIRAGKQIVKSVTPKEEAVPAPGAVSLILHGLDFGMAGGGADSGMGFGTGVGAMGSAGGAEGGFGMGAGPVDGFPSNAPVTRDDPAGVKGQLAEVLKQLESLRATVERLRRELNSESRDEKEDGSRSEE